MKTIEIVMSLVIAFIVIAMAFMVFNSTATTQITNSTLQNTTYKGIGLFSSMMHVASPLALIVVGAILIIILGYIASILMNKNTST